MDGVSRTYQWPRVNRIVDSVNGDLSVATDAEKESFSLQDSEQAECMAQNEEPTEAAAGRTHNNTQQLQRIHNHQVPSLPPRHENQANLPVAMKDSRQGQQLDDVPDPNPNSTTELSMKNEWQQVNVRNILLESVSTADQEWRILEGPPEQSHCHHDARLGQKVLETETTQAEEQLNPNGYSHPNPGLFFLQKRTEPIELENDQPHDRLPSQVQDKESAQEYREENNQRQASQQQLQQTEASPPTQQQHPEQESAGPQHQRKSTDDDNDRHSDEQQTSQLLENQDLFAFESQQVQTAPQIQNNSELQQNKQREVAYQIDAGRHDQARSRQMERHSWEQWQANASPQLQCGGLLPFQKEQQLQFRPRYQQQQYQENSSNQPQRGPNLQQRHQYQILQHDDGRHQKQIGDRQANVAPDIHSQDPSTTSRARLTNKPPIQDKLRTPADYPEELGTVHDILIIGGGVVGLATLRAVTLAGYKAVLVEAEPDLLPGASAGNSGIVCTGVDASPGSLERALIRDSISQFRPFLKKHRIPHRECGSLVCQWEWDKVGNGRYQSHLNKVLAESHDAGDTHARKLSPQELGQLEPNVSPLCLGAIHIPGEIVVDPWLYSIALAAHARENGARIFTHFEYDPQSSFFDHNRRIWTIRRKTANECVQNVHRPDFILARSVVNAAGIMADLVQAATKDADPPHWRAKPRRGQYRVFLADRVTYITHPIQPFPLQRTKGIFVYSSLYNHIVVGPTAEEQESRTDKRVNPRVSDDLTTHALRIIPDLDPQKQHIGEYVGIRPATEHRDYQIRLSAHSNWIVAAGIRSTGLTGSLGIGRHILHLLESILPPPKQASSIRNTPMPEMIDLVNHFNSNPEGYVLIHGYLYRVTHPLTRLGFKMRTGIAAPRKGRS